MDASNEEIHKSVYRRGFAMGSKSNTEAYTEMIDWIHRNLGPLLKAETKLSTKDAYRFGTDFAKLLKLKYLNIDEFDGYEEILDLPNTIFVRGE